MSEGRAVRVYTPSYDLLGEFPSRRVAADALGVGSASVSIACSHRHNYLGLVWRNADDDELYANARHDTVNLDYLRSLCSTNAHGSPRCVISQYSLEGDFIKSWRDASKIERVLGLKRDAILNCCKGVSKSYGGFIWKYAVNDESAKKAKSVEMSLTHEVSGSDEPDESGEVWRLVETHDVYSVKNYEVSNFGRVRRSGYTDGSGKYHPPRLLSLQTGSGHVQVALSHGVGGVRRVNVHILVADAFIPNPEGLRAVRHLDGNILNCHVDNLKRCSTSEISKLCDSGAYIRENFSKAVRQYTPYGVLVGEYQSSCEVERLFGFDDTSIRKCCARQVERKTSCGFAWRFVDDDELFSLSEAERFKLLSLRVVRQYTKDGKLVMEHPSVYAARATAGIRDSCINKCLAKKRPSANGFVWRYADDDELHGGSQDVST